VTGKREGREKKGGNDAARWGLAVGMATAISAPREGLAAQDEPTLGRIAIGACEPLAGIDAIAHGGDGEEGQQTNGSDEDDGFHDGLQ